jgi:hypothetical protein
VARAGTTQSRLIAVLPGTLAVALASVIMAGCATVPSSDAPRQVLTGGNAVEEYVRPLPPPGPGSGQYKTPTQIVLGFLSASASYAFDPAAARQFLAPAMRATWRPGPVTVVGSPGKAVELPYYAGAASSAPAPESKSVEFTAQHLATLGQLGQYEYLPGATPTPYTFDLTQMNGIWLITGLPQGGRSLLLTQTSFEEVYQPRNLFFFARQGSSQAKQLTQPRNLFFAVRGGPSGDLIPDPVYAPVQSADSALNTDVAEGLIKGLLSDHSSWLSESTTTAFPGGTKLLKVAIRGQTAVVNLGGSAARASQQRKDAMSAQLLATLGSSAYSGPLARHVVLEINGQVQPTDSSAYVVSPVGTSPFIYQSDGAVKQLNPPSVLVSARQIGSAEVTALATTSDSAGSGGPLVAGGSTARPVPAVAVAVRNGNGCAVYVPDGWTAAQPGGSYKRYALTSSGGPCTSLSWDRTGNLWATAGGRIWLLQQQSSEPLAVSPPANLPSDGKSGPQILSLQMAPDGVRAALLVKVPGRNRVLLTAVIDRRRSASLGPAVPAWSRLPDPASLSWYSAYDLVALTSNGIWQVPLTGGSGRELGAAPAGAVSLTSNGNALMVATAKGAVEESTNGANSWGVATLGTLPSYPS